MNRIARGTRLPLALLMAASPVTARATDDPCASDTARWCDGKSPTDLASCLQSHRADLPGSCQDYVEWAMVSVQSPIQDCQPEASTSACSTGARACRPPAARR